MTISPLQYITTRPEQAEAACRAGIDWVQLRVKDRSYANWKALALETLAVCRQFNARLIINDNVALAGEIGADGVHVGLTDMPVAEARRLLGPAVLIGGTANTLDHIRLHYDAGADYVGLGPFRFTSTKEKLSPILGLDGYGQLLAACRRDGISVPVVAIGGISVADIPAILQQGVFGIAVSQAISSDIATQVPAFRNAIQSARLSSTVDN
jgi:thiamine-phosphate pyrophosphorylase